MQRCSRALEPRLCVHCTMRRSTISSHGCYFLIAIAQYASALVLVSFWCPSLSSLSSSRQSRGGRGFVGGKRSLQALEPNVAGRSAPTGSHRRRDMGSKQEPKEIRLQSTSQPQYIIGNVMCHVHIKCPQSISSQKSYCTFPQQHFFHELHPDHDHTKLHQVWHDTLATTSRANGPTSVSISPLSASRNVSVWFQPLNWVFHNCKMARNAKSYDVMHEIATSITYIESQTWSIKIVIDVISQYVWWLHCSNPFDDILNLKMFEMCGDGEQSVPT